MVKTGAVIEFLHADGKPVKAFPAASRPRETSLLCLREEDGGYRLTVRKGDEAVYP